VAVGLIFAYLARASLIAYIGNQWTLQLVSQLSMAVLIVGSTYAVLGGVSAVQWRGLAMIAAGAASLWHCETVDFALARWGGWVLMLIAVGPVLATPLAIRFRHSTMETTRAAIVAVTLLSAAWWIVGLPNLGRGDFTGVMWHSMTLGPLAALAALIALSRAMSRGALAWYAVFALAGGIVVLAASRSALVGLALGTMLILALRLKRRPVLSAFALIAGLMAACVPDAALDLVAGAAPDSLVAGLTRKSWEHTREAHWEARWEEFRYSPLTGVGFACGWDGTAGYNDETGAIETGSSYLSILSMTGLAGAAAFLLVISKPAIDTVRNWRALGERAQLEVAGLAGFWAVHLGAEGYVYGVGSLLGLTFWLWLGWLGDQIRIAPARGAR
jgi:O-antigen ligase